MNRYLLFCGDDYYPSRRWRFAGDFPTMVAAIERLGEPDWWNILDTRTRQVYTSYQVNGDRMAWAAGIDAEG